MEADLLADIFHGKLQLRLIAGDGLVLCAVILKGLMYLLHVGNEPHIAHQQRHLDDALKNGLAPVGSAQQSQRE